jgi:hypothetical protein
MAKRYTWAELRAIVDEGKPERVRRAIRRAPRRWRRALALAFSVAKWDAAPRGEPGNGPCGLCEYYRRRRSPRSCRPCPLWARWGSICDEWGSPWWRWDDAWRPEQAAQRAAAAAVIHRDLLALYAAELRRLGWWPKGA